jgi:flagellar hook-associated protein 3 FlgL
MSMRITNAMVTRNVLASLNEVSDKLTRAQQKAASGKEISRPSDDPFNAARAMALRQGMSATQQYKRNIEDATGWTEATEQALAQITEVAQRARDLLVQGGADAADPTSREAIAAELEQIIESVKETASATYRGAYLFSGTDVNDRPYLPGADDSFRCDQAGANPAIPGVIREIGPGVTMTINTVGSDVLGRGQGAADGKLLHVLRDAVDDLRSGDGAAIRTDLGRLDGELEALLEVRAANGARANRLDAALTRLDEVEESHLRQLTNTESADIAKVLIELNSQTAAYQSALRAGASIVQSSLMDFLR